MKKWVKALYVLIVGLIVFTGALMIARGAGQRESSPPEKAQTIRTVPFDEEEGSAV